MINLLVLICIAFSILTVLGLQKTAQAAVDEVSFRKVGSLNHRSLSVRESISCQYLPFVLQPSPQEHV